jgi:hypothetical protein
MKGVNYGNNWTYGPRFYNVVFFQELVIIANAAIPRK